MTPEYNDKMLYNQLLYYDMLFDIDKAKKATSDDKGDSLPFPPLIFRYFVRTRGTESRGIQCYPNSDR
jgi:DNA Polymerase alpha zinc finger